MKQVTAILLGAGQRVLDKMHLSDRAALMIIAAMFIGGLLPDIDTLRETYIAARRVGSRPLRVKDESALIAEIAREADQTQLTAAAELIALCDMGLVQIKDDPPGVETPRGVKMDPAENRIFQKAL